MKLIRGLNPELRFNQGVVATIGNFDGVHLGHQALLSKLRLKAKALDCPMLVFLFEPQPAEFFRGAQAPSRLSSLREKLMVLAKAGVDYVVCLRFDRKLAQMSAEDFARRYFFSQLGLSYLLVGSDFRFGAGRQGDINLLTSVAASFGAEIEAFEDYSLLIDSTKIRVSSTAIRMALDQGELDIASMFLGRTYSLCGRVIRGDGRGREWGFPTANISIKRISLPLKGVFCVQVKRQNGQCINGVANMGSRPTVDGSKNVLEIHLLDFNEDLYGERLQVFFLQKLRDEIKFSSVDALISQIHDDIKVARSQFNDRGFEVNA